VTGARVSFVIPVLNEQERITGLLCDLKARFPAAELIVVDGGSGDRTVAAAMPHCSRLLIGERGRAQQMNLGARAASGDYICFLHADSRPGVTAAQLAGALAGQPMWGFCRVRLSSPRPVFRLIEWFMNQRSRLTAIATGDQMLYLTRELFERIGGFDCIPLMEDVALCKRLRRLGRPLIIDQPVATSSRRWEQHGVARTVVTMWWLRLAYVAGVSPQRLWQHYYGR
jgi:rSAM/selenodomain-associated transferase 2